MHEKKPIAAGCSSSEPPGSGSVQYGLGQDWSSIYEILKLAGVGLRPLLLGEGYLLFTPYHMLFVVLQNIYNKRKVFKPGDITATSQTDSNGKKRTLSGGECPSTDVDDDSNMPQLLHNKIQRFIS